MQLPGIFDVLPKPESLEILVRSRSLGAGYMMPVWAPRAAPIVKIY